MPIVWTDVPEANDLLESDPLALLIGLVLDQQVKMEKAFRGPYDLKQRLGGRRRLGGDDGRSAAGQARYEGKQTGLIPFTFRSGPSRGFGRRDLVETEMR